MKFVHAYILYALSAITLIKGAEKQQEPLTKKQILIQALNSLTAVPKIRHTKTEKQEIFSDGRIIFGSSTYDNIPLYERPLNIYPMRPINDSKVKPHLTAFRTYLDRSTKERIEHISKDRTFLKKSKITSSKSEPKNTDSSIFNPKTKQGHATQVLTQLKEETHPESITAHKNELKWEIQKGIAALTIRYKQLGTSIERAEQLQQNLNQRHQIMHDDFVFIVNALIDDIKANSQETITDQQAINLLFKQEASFTLTQEKFNMLNQNTDEHIPDFNHFNNCYGSLPIEIAASARNVYNSWWTSQGEPAIATDLRTANYKLSTTQEAKEKEELQAYITNLRTRIYSAIIKHIRTFSDERLVDINYDLAEARAEEQKIAQQLQHILPKDIAPEKAITQAMGWSKNKQQEASLIATRLAKALV